MKKWTREVIEEIEKIGVNVVHVEENRGSGHTALTVRSGARQGKIFIAGTVSDWRAMKNIVSLARRFKEGHDLAVVREAPREPKPKRKRK